MTLVAHIRWRWDRWRHPRRATPPRMPFAGKFVECHPRSSRTLGHVDYALMSARGQFHLGLVVWSSQWAEYSWRQLPNDTPLNQAIVAEVYAVLRDLNKRENVGHAYPGWRPR